MGCPSTCVAASQRIACARCAAIGHCVFTLRLLLCNAAGLPSLQELDRLERTLLADSAIDTEFSGSTAVFAAVRDRQLHVCNVGDSRIIVGRSIGGGKLQAFDVSNDHKPDLDAEKARIVATGGRVFAVEVSALPSSFCCTMQQRSAGHDRRGKCVMGFGHAQFPPCCCVHDPTFEHAMGTQRACSSRLLLLPCLRPLLCVSSVRGRCVWPRPCVAG